MYNMIRAWNHRAQRTQKPHKKELSTLLALVYGLRPTDATDLRDKIFAAMPYATDLAQSSLTIDYTRDLFDVYTDIELLGYVYTRPEYIKSEEDNELLKPDLPSWVPDWRYRIDVRPLNKTGIVRPFPLHPWLRRRQDLLPRSARHNHGQKRHGTRHGQDLPPPT